MPRATYISFDRFPAPKGAAVHIAAFAAALAKAYGAVDLLTLPSGEEQLPAALPGVNHVALAAGGPHLIGQILNFRSSLAHWLRTKPPRDVIHVRSPFEGYPIARDGHQHTRHLIYEVNGVPSIELKYHHAGVQDDAELMRKLLHQEQILMERADLLITPSAVTACYLQTRGVPQSRIKVIPNGVDLDTFAFAPPRQAQAVKRLLYVGTFTGWQGLGVILSALALLRQAVLVELVVIGFSRARQLRRLQDEASRLGVADIVTWLPAMAQNDLVAWHHKSDIALAPLVPNDRNMVQGCCPLKVLEAMAAGTPVVASDLPVVSDLLTNNVQGVLVPPGNLQALTDAVASLLGDPDRALRLSLAARARVQAHYTWARAQSALVQSYDDLLGTAPQARFNTLANDSSSVPA